MAELIRRRQQAQQGRTLRGLPVTRKPSSIISSGSQSSMTTSSSILISPGVGSMKCSRVPSISTISVPACGHDEPDGAASA